MDFLAHFGVTADVEDGTIRKELDDEILLIGELVLNVFFLSGEISAESHVELRQDFVGLGFL